MELFKRLAIAQNYAYECTMNDYSIESIRRADADLSDIKAEIESLGYDPKTVTFWNGRFWEPVPDGWTSEVPSLRDSQMGMIYLTGPNNVRLVKSPIVPWVQSHSVHKYTIRTLDWDLTKSLAMLEA